MIEQKFKVTKDAMRPASKAKRCFYCRVRIGRNHKAGCVLVRKTVKVKMTVVYDITVPAHWTQEQIDFHRNNSSWCRSNAIEELWKIDRTNCICDITTFQYLYDSSKPFLDEK